jgi:hypothetical protein
MRVVSMRMNVPRFGCPLGRRKAPADAKPSDPVDVNIMHIHPNRKRRAHPIAPFEPYRMLPPLLPQTTPALRSEVKSQR